MIFSCIPPRFSSFIKDHLHSFFFFIGRSDIIFFTLNLLCLKNREFSPSQNFLKRANKKILIF